jgi:2-dehydropantoate 2-reductase
MSGQSPRILVVGAGVNGSVCASELHRAGFNVTVLVRRQHYQELIERGIEIENPLNGIRTVAKAPVIDHLAPDDIYDYILAVVRKNQVWELVPSLAQNHSPCVVFMVNTALGPEEWIAALGANRLMLGFAFAGGRREGGVLRAMRAKAASTPFGEASGALTPRLTRLIGILNHARLKRASSRTCPTGLQPTQRWWRPSQCSSLKMVAITTPWPARRATCASSPLRSPRVTPCCVPTARRIVPRAFAVIGALPRFALAALFRLFLACKYAEIGAAWHCSQAPDEMNQLAKELKELVERSGLPVPALRQILAGVETIPELT